MERLLPGQGRVGVNGRSLAGGNRKFCRGPAGGGRRRASELNATDLNI